MDMTITASAFSANQSIPSLYTCEGKDISPALNWQNVPAQAKSLVLIVDDPDAPDPKSPQRTWVHWVLYNIPAQTNGLPENVGVLNLPQGTLNGLNDWNREGYGGPCPPIGEHRYFFKLYALNTVLPDLHKPTKAQLLQAMQGKVIQEVQMIGLYQKQKK
ncbi:MAG: YbhB/YbcL family Raf kinase inhibitor-like protein [Gammaproteobacteria bacterium]